MPAQPTPPTPLSSALGLFISDEELLALVNDDQHFWPRHTRQVTPPCRLGECRMTQKGAERVRRISKPPKRVAAAQLAPPVCGLSPTEAQGEFFIVVVEEEEPPSAALEAPPSLLSLPPQRRPPIPSFQPLPPSSPILIPLDRTSQSTLSSDSSLTLWRLDEPCLSPVDPSYPSFPDAPLVRPTFLPPEEPLSDSPCSYSTVSSSVPTPPPSSPLPLQALPPRLKSRKLPHPPPATPALPPTPLLTFDSLFHEPDDADFMGLDGCFSFSSPLPLEGKGVAALARSPLAAGHVARMRRQEAKVLRRIEQYEWLENRLFGWVEDQRGRKVREV